MSSLPTGGRSPAPVDELQAVTARSAPRRTIVMLLVGSAALLWIAARSLLDRGPVFEVLALAAAFLPAAVTTVFALRLARSSHVEPRTRTGWWLLAAGGGASSVFALAATMPAAVSGSEAVAVAGVVAHLVLLGALMLGVLSWLRGFSAAATAATLLDLSCLALLAYVLSWNTTLGPALLGVAESTEFLARGTMFATPALDVLILVGVVTVIAQAGRSDVRGPELLATMGVAAIVASDVSIVLGSVEAGGFIDRWREVTTTGSRSFADLGWVVGLLAVGFAAAHRVDTAAAAPERHVPFIERSSTWELVVSLLPFGFLALAIAAWLDGSLLGASTATLTRGLLATLSALLLARCALVTVVALRANHTSSIDQLTGAFSHREFQEQIPILVERARASGSGLVLMMVDIDDFEVLNDEVSHAEGDRFLQETCWMIRHEIAEHHLLFRNGGDEFAVAMPGTTVADAAEHARRISAEATRMRGTGAFSPSVTIGIAAAPAHTTDPHELVQLASGSLYWGKLNGKNSVTTYDPAVVNILSAADRVEVVERTTRLRAVLALARALDARDAYTARHSENVSRYAVAIATELGWTPERVELLRVAGLLHDIGKIGVRDSTLRKASKLSPEEWDEMREHPVLGARMVEGVAPDEIIPWIISHHERIDGRGYPHALIGLDIPDGARVLAVADTFDAMTSSRSYRPALSPLRAIDEIATGSGEQFDPDVVRAFLLALHSGAIDVAAIARDVRDAPQQEAHVEPATDYLTVVDPEFAADDDAADDEAAAAA